MPFKRLYLPCLTDGPTHVATFLSRNATPWFVLRHFVLVHLCTSPLFNCLHSSKAMPSGHLDTARLTGALAITLSYQRFSFSWVIETS